MSLNAQSMRDMLIDTTDNAVDVSNWLGSVTGFVPLIMPITEPAIGYGAGGGLIFFHPNDYRVAVQEGRFQDIKKNNISPTPPSVTMVGGLYTESNSWGVGGAHMQVFKGDKFRYTIAGGYASVNLNYYSTYFPNLNLRFNTKVWGITNEGIMRIKTTDFWVGIGYAFAQLDLTFDKLFDTPDLGYNTIKTRNGALFPSIAYDSRDNIFTPNHGFKTHLKYSYSDTWLGSTETYQSFMGYVYAYHDWTEGHVTGLRVESQNTFGDPTFIYLPYVSLRGVPAMKYQDKFTLLSEMEQRIKVYNRWSLVVFGGVGKAIPSFSEWTTQELVYSYGTGFRYYLAKKFGTHMGMDFAWGPDDFAFYITFGSAWMRL